MLIKFLQYLKLRGVSSASLKYYKSDLLSFLTWAGTKKINQNLIQEYINSIRLVTPISTLKRRQSTLRSYASFMGFKKISSTWQESILSKFEHRERLKIILHKLFFVRPNWYKTYHTYPIASYIHIAILVLFTSLSGYALYDQVFRNANNPLAFPTALTRPNRFLSFQGRLTSNIGNPITTATNLVFKLYTASTAGTELWSSGTCSITPDQDGIFSTLLGSSCGAEIAATVFSENASVWVGVTVAADAEATPRVQIATVAYALNSETLQGYPAGTGTSTIPYIASTGTLVLANASPKIQSTSGTFAVEGLAMTITTPNTSNGVITINPDGVGTLDLTFEGAAPGLSANGFLNAVNANITSGALYGGTVASAATGYNFIDFQSGVSPTSKFSVSATGQITSASGLTIGTTSLSETTAANDSGAYLVGTFDEFGNSSSANVQDVLDDLDAAITTAAGAPTWSSIIAPTANLSLAHAGYTTAFTFDSLTSASAFALSSTSTAGGASGVSKLLDINRSGTNSNASHTAYGLYSAVTNTGTTSTNIGGYFSASGATNNYGLIVGTGNVGIGTTGPTEELHIKGTAYPTLYLESTDSQGGQIRLASDGGSYYQYTTGGDLRFYASGNDNVTFKSTGNVGIGTTGPTQMLTVQSSAVATAIKGTTTYVSGTTNAVTGEAITPNASTNRAFYANANNSGGGAAYSFYGYAGVFYNNGKGIFVGADDDLQLKVKGNATQTANLQEWQTSAGTVIGSISNAGNGYFAGNVGIGTTSPLSKLHVVGSCVTGDTLLRIRRRRRKKTNGLESDDDEDLLFDYLFCRIDEIVPGDEVLSLNESSGDLEHAKVNRLMDMGIKEVYELVTKSGKVIRTTANHPYLTLLEDNPIDNMEKINI